MPRKKTRVAIIYDFDKTLATTDMQNYSFIKEVGLTVPEFWEKTGKFCSENNSDKILGYMYMMIKCAKDAGIPLTRKFLNECGKNVVLFPGVEEWFSRINDYGKTRNIIVEHYICSSGNKEIIDGTNIAKKFKKIFGCEFAYHPETKEAIWPKNAINYTQKTQYVFRISKGALDISDDDKVNEKTKKKRIEYKNMIYIGDGITDVPCMEIIKNSGGHSIAIISNSNKEIAKKLATDKRVQFTAKPDYREDSKLDKIVKKIFDMIEIQSYLGIHDKEKSEIGGKR
jgi:phosphoserine phosphatase